MSKFLQAISETLIETYARAEEQSVWDDYEIWCFRCRSRLRSVRLETKRASTCMSLRERFVVLSNRYEKSSSTVNCLTLIWSILSKMLRLSYRASITNRDEFCQRNLLSNDLMTKTVQFRCQNWHEFSNLQVLAWVIVTHSLKVIAICTVYCLWLVNILHLFCVECYNLSL